MLGENAEPAILGVNTTTNYSCSDHDGSAEVPRLDAADTASLQKRRHASDVDFGCAKAWRPSRCRTSWTGFR